MNPRLAILERRMKLQTPEKPPVPADDLGGVIEAAIQRRVDAALENHERTQSQSSHTKRLLDQFNAPKPVTDYRELPPVPKTPAPIALEYQVQRDPMGRICNLNAINAVSGDLVRMYSVQRNETGEIVKVIPVAR